MPPTLGGLDIRRPLTAILSALAVFALAFLGAIPNAPRGAAASATTRSAQLNAKATAYTDRKKAKASYHNASTAKVDRSRYAAYFAFPPASLAKGEAVTQAKLTLAVKSASQASLGKLAVRPVVSGWTGGKVTYKSRPKVGPVIGTAKTKAKGKITITLNPAAAQRYLTSGLNLQVTRTGTKHLVKLAKKPVALKVNVASSVTAAEVGSPDSGTIPGLGAISNKPVFAHYFPPYPISLDNVNGQSDYYAKHYLQATGENGKFASYGGFLRDRPIPRSPLSGDYQLTDMQTEVNQAKDAGITGFAVDILTFNTADRNWILVEKLLQASAKSGSFKVMLQPDMAALKDTTTTKFAAAIANLAKSDAVYRLNTGEVVISPFLTENKTPSWYADAIKQLKSQYGVSAVLLPLFLDAANMKSYASISVGFGNWGIRNTAAAATWTNWSAKAHALNKLWMEPVSVQDVRPAQRIYDEANNTETLAATWNRAIGQGADLVLLTTWNDYSESTSFAPSTDHGLAFLDLNRYYLTKYRTGSAEVRQEKVIISHRIQKASTPVTYAATMKPRAGSPAARDKVEVVTLLKQAASVTVTIGGKNFTYQATAGKYAKLFDLAEGKFSATVTRTTSTVASVTTQDAVSFGTTSQQDLSYHAVSN